MRLLTRLSCRLKKKFKKRLFNYGQDIVMAFSSPVVGCLVKKRLAKGGGGHGHPRIPLATPLFIRIHLEMDMRSFCAISPGLWTETIKLSPTLNELDSTALQVEKRQVKVSRVYPLNLTKIYNNNNHFTEVSMALSKHSCFTNWGDYKSKWITTNRIKCWFLMRKKKPGVPGEKPPRAE